MKKLNKITLFVLSALIMTSSMLVSASPEVVLALNDESSYTNDCCDTLHDENYHISSDGTYIDYIYIDAGLTEEEILLEIERLANEKRDEIISQIMGGLTEESDSRNIFCSIGIHNYQPYSQLFSSHVYIAGIHRPELCYLELYEWRVCINCGVSPVGETVKVTRYSGCLT